MRNSSWLGTTFLFVALNGALYGIAPVGAITIPGMPAQTQLQAQQSSGTVVLVKKNKRKSWKKRHALRKSPRRHRASRQRGKAHRHIARGPHRHGFMLVVPMDPNGVWQMAPHFQPRPPLPDHGQAARAPSYAMPEEPDLTGPALAPPYEDRQAIIGKGVPSSAALGRITCDQGAGIVTDFGFSDVQTSSCSGEDYEFAAMRDGQPYRIRMRSDNGELTEVRRQ